MGGDFTRRARLNHMWSTLTTAELGLGLSIRVIDARESWTWLDRTACHPIACWTSQSVPIFTMDRLNVPGPFPETLYPTPSHLRVLRLCFVHFKVPEITHLSASPSRERKSVKIEWPRN